jgi:hypothetical protein
MESENKCSKILSKVIREETIITSSNKSQKHNCEGRIQFWKL